ncbi:metallophosphoesterase [Pediococcus argentinicus]|uniref:metallophosphoesterase n=1 Tax=Pediococcus argentinicus TaxID=480391 RepID=UPI00338D6EB8
MIFGLFGLFIVMLPLYAFKIEPNMLTVKQVQINENKDANATKLKIVQISDLHISNSYPVGKLDKVIKDVNQQQPDIIVFNGDLYDNFASYPYQNEVSAKLAQMKAKVGKFAVWGNHDYGGGESRVYDSVMANGGFKILKNTGEMLNVNGRSVFIGGMDDSILGHPSIPEALQYRVGQPNYSIMLTHEPDVADQLVNTGTQLVLAGHSHGGQIKLPFYQETNVLSRKYIKGLYTLNGGMKLYVNTGIGTTRVHARFGVRPEISVLNVNI